MVQTFLTVFLSWFNTGNVLTAQAQICVWPNPCRSEAVAVAQITTCVWPNPCGAKAQVG